jgi:hypothetical protein
VNVETPDRRSFTRLAVSVVAAVVLGSFASCGEITTTPIDSGGKEKTPSEKTPSEPPAPGSAGGPANSFTVTPGGYQSAQVTGPGKISFTVVGINMDLDKDAWPIIFFYDSMGYTGGKGGSGGFNGDLRNFKLKFYDSNGVIASESYYVEPKGNTPRWDPAVARTVSLEWGSDYVQSTIDGIPFRKAGSVSGTFIVGIGYPPSIRAGWDNAVYTNIVWPAGSTRIK